MPTNEPADHKDSVAKILARALQGFGIGVMVFVVANFSRGRLLEMAIRAVVAVTALVLGAIIERKRKR